MIAGQTTELLNERSASMIGENVDGGFRTAVSRVKWCVDCQKSPFNGVSVVRRKIRYKKLGDLETSSINFVI